MKDVFVLFIMTKNQHFKNCLTRINLFRYTIHICKISQQKGLSPKVFTNIFTPRNQPNYNLPHITCFKMPLVNFVYNETESIAFLGPKIWELILEVVKQKKSLNNFKDTIRKIVANKLPM